MEVKALLKELRRMGKTILISSHILTELADCCTSIGIIERGQLLMHGPIAEVYRRIRGNRMVVIRFANNMEAGLSIIRSYPQLRDVQVEDSMPRSNWTRTMPASRNCCGSWSARTSASAATAKRNRPWKTCSCSSRRDW